MSLYEHLRGEEATHGHSEAWAGAASHLPPQRAQRLGTVLGRAANPRTFLHPPVYRRQSVPRWYVCCLCFFLCLLTTSLSLLCLCPTSSTITASSRSSIHHCGPGRNPLLLSRDSVVSASPPQGPRVSVSLRVDEFPFRQVGHSLLILYSQRCPSQVGSIRAVTVQACALSDSSPETLSLWGLGVGMGLVRS